MKHWFDYLPDPPSFIASIWSELTILLLLLVLRVCGVDVFRKIKWLYRLVLGSFIRLSGRRIIFVYTDCDDRQVTNRGLKEGLENGLSKVHVVCIDNPEQLLDWPIHPLLVHSCMLFITDVTPLSAAEDKRVRIQTKLENYVHSGGVLLLGHDVLYRRSKNPVLQKLAGCQLREFTPLKHSLTYKLFREENSPRYSRAFIHGLPETFELADREYVTGDWASDVKYIYVAAVEQAKQIPLVTYRTCGKGSILWFNSGDSTMDGPPESLSGPNDNFIVVVCALAARAQLRSFRGYS